MQAGIADSILTTPSPGVITSRSAAVVHFVFFSGYNSSKVKNLSCKDLTLAVFSFYPVLPQSLSHIHDFQMFYWIHGYCLPMRCRSCQWRYPKHYSMQCWKATSALISSKISFIQSPGGHKCFQKFLCFAIFLDPTAKTWHHLQGQTLHNGIYELTDKV